MTGLSRTQRAFFYPALVVLCVLAMLAEACGAFAYSPQQLATYTRVADQQFPQSRCAGQLTANVVTSIPTTAENAAAGLATMGQATGMADGSCSFLIVDGQTPYDACLTVVHESLHLAGFGHTATGIMSPNAAEAMAGWRYAPCAGVIPPVLSHDSAWIAVDDRWHPLTLDCRRAGDPSRQRCYGTSQVGRRLNFVVWMDGAHAIHTGRVS